MLMGEVPISDPATVDRPSTTNAICCLGNCLFSFTKPAIRRACQERRFSIRMAFIGPVAAGALPEAEAITIQGRTNWNHGVSGRPPALTAFSL